MVRVSGNGTRAGKTGSSLAAAIALAGTIAVAPGLPAQTPQPVPIGDVLVDADGDFVPDLVNQVVSIAGVATTYPRQARGSTQYVVVQDESGGIRLLSNDLDLWAGIEPGTRVAASGLLTHRRGADELMVETISARGNTAPPTPREVLVADLLTERYANQLVRVTGELNPVGRDLRQDFYATLTDRSGSVPVRIPVRFFEDADLVGKLSTGGRVDVVGIAGQADRVAPFDGGYRLAPREASDLSFEPVTPFAAIALGAIVLFLVAAITIIWKRRRTVEKRAADLARLAADLEMARSAHEASECRYRSLFEKDLTGNFVADTDGRILECNVAFAKTFGYPSSDQLIRSGFMLGDHVHGWNTAVALVDSEGAAKLSPMEVPCPEGEPKHLLTNITARCDESGQVNGLSGSFVDVSKQQRLERQLFQAQKMEAVGRTAGGIAHDLNNVLMTVTGGAQLLLERPLDADVTEALGWIEQAAERGGELSRRLLTLSQHEVTHPRVVDLNVEIRDVAPILRGLLSTNVELVTLDTSTPAWIKIDPSHLNQLLFNLVANARDAMSGTGKLTLEIACLPADGTDGSNEAESGHRNVFLSVADTGSGIAEENLDKLFEPFFSTKESGSGLGLAIVYGIVSGSGGKISVHSKEHEGTRFEIRWPEAQTAGEAPQIVEAEVCGAADASGTVLLAEDDPGVRNLICNTLETIGYSIVQAGNGEEAWRLFQESPDAFDVVLTDMVMPLMGGGELAERVASSRPDLPVVFMSGYFEDADARRLMSSENAVFLQKPWPIADLRNAIGKAIKSQSGSQT